MMIRLQWFGYIKDYDGGTLMESLLHSELPYTSMPQMILAQKEELDRRIRDLSTAQIVYPGLKYFQEESYEPMEIRDVPGNYCHELLYQVPRGFLLLFGGDT